MLIELIDKLKLGNAHCFVHVHFIPTCMSLLE